VCGEFYFSSSVFCAKTSMVLKYFDDKIILTASAAQAQKVQSYFSSAINNFS